MDKCKRQLPQIILLTAGQHPVGDVICRNPSSSTITGMLRSIINEHPSLQIRGFDLDPNDLELSLEEAVQEIFVDSSNSSARFPILRTGERYVTKVVSAKESESETSLPIELSSGRFQLVLPKTKSISDLEFGELPDFSLEPTEIEIRVVSCGLNFRDVLSVLTPEVFKKPSIGLDFAGEVCAVGEKVTMWKIGDSVYGMNGVGGHNALPSHVRQMQTHAQALPEGLSYSEGASLPTAFATVFYCLESVTKCKQGDSILIHAASGGVGLVAMQLAKHFGLKIFCTAGSNRKRAYLRYLGAEHVFHSRNTKFGDEILKVTAGKGVNIILNSLTGPGFKESSLQACAEGGRFIELSKMNVWLEEDVRLLRPDVQYNIVDLSAMEVDEISSLIKSLNGLFQQGILKPLPCTRFGAKNIRQALTYMQQAKHIGKIVIAMPEPHISPSKPPLFNSRSSYLITGGLSGVGFEVCKYMIDNGAKHVILMGRRPPSSRVDDEIRDLRTLKAANIVVFQADVGCWDECLIVFDSILDPKYKLPPLRGIMHSAGALADSVFDNLEWQHFETTFKAKVDGTWNLHKLSLNMNLECFVMFSSISGTFGSTGQATHVAACTFQDTFAHFRRSNGFPATSINWGQFGEVGASADLQFQVIVPFATQQGLNALDHILRHQKNNIIVGAFTKNAPTLIKTNFPYAHSIMHEKLLEEMLAGSQTEKKLNSVVELSSAQFWSEYNKCREEDTDRASSIVAKYCKNILKFVLRLSAEELVADNVHLDQIGVDSLLRIELRNVLETVLGEKFKVPTSLFDDCTMATLTARVVAVIESNPENSGEAAAKQERFRELVNDDCQLPEHINASVPGSEKKPSEFKSVLLVGATGFLGSHILLELLNEYPQLTKLYCLVRPSKDMTARERLDRVLLSRARDTVPHLKKVHVVPGEMGAVNFGLPSETYTMLTEQVDVVINCGATINHVELYESREGGHDARTVNVLGLHRLLNFCGSPPFTKHLIHASSLLAVSKINCLDKSVFETWPTTDETRFGCNRGYPISKYVGDFLIGQATQERNIPCKSFRYPEIRSSPLTNGSFTEASQGMRTFLYFLKTAMFPNITMPALMLPVDVCAKLTCKVMFNDAAPNQVYNVVHPNGKLLNDFFPHLPQELGFHLTLVDWEDFRSDILNGLYENCEDGCQSLLAPFRDLYKEKNLSLELISGPLLDKKEKCDLDFRKCYYSKRLASLVPELYNDQMESTYETLKRDLLMAKEEGIFEKYGVHPK